MPIWLNQRTATLDDRDPPDGSGESSIDRRAREVTREANQRWYERRVRADVPLDQRSYPEDANWFTSEGAPVPANWPWWLW